MKEDKVGGTCGMQGGGERFTQGSGWEARMLENTGKT
jgi:hypothetical protein